MNKNQKNDSEPKKEGINNLIDAYPGATHPPIPLYLISITITWIGRAILFSSPFRDCGVRNKKKGKKKA